MINRDNLNNLYWKKNLTLKEIAKKLNNNYSQIGRLMDKFNIKRRSTSEAKLKGKYKPTKEELCDIYYDKKLNSKEIASKFKVGQTTILRWMEEFNIKKRNSSEAKLKGKYKPTKEELYDLYWKKGLSTVELEKKYKVHNKTIAGWMRDYNIKIRVLGIAQSNLRLLAKNKLKELYIKKRLSCKKISEIYNTQDESVRRILVHYDINRRNNNGKNHPNWTGGHSCEPYSPEFTDKLKKEIKKRDNYICQRCNDKLLKNNKKRQNKRWLEIHYIDYNKLNSKKKNLITLCNQCNIDANKNRDYWKRFFINKLKINGEKISQTKTKNLKKVRLFSMFSGYGGAEFALKKSNIDFECIGYSEIDKYAIQCYIQNFQNTKNFGDCKSINPNDLPDFDLLTGGFPCTTFSVAGKRKGELDPKGILFYDIIRIAKVKKPKWMLLENVKGLMSKKFKITFNKILNELDVIGYNVIWKIFNSKNYGMPQNRERIFFICFRKDLEMNFEFPREEKLNLFLEDILEKEVDRKYNISDKAKKVLKFKKNILNINNSSKLINVAILNKGGHGDRVYSPKGISVTLCARGGGRGAKTGLYITELQEVRKLTPNECFRLMGFLNNEINLEGLSDNQKYKLAGNGWDIRLVSKIFKKMLK